MESGAIRTLTALHLLRFTNVPTFAFRISANSCCCCYPRGCAPSTPLENAAFLHPISVSSRDRVAAKCTTCRCVTYIGWLSRKRLISNLPACRGSILGDPDIQKPSPPSPSASPPPPPPPSPPLPPTTPSPVHSCFQQPPPRSSGPIQLPPLVVTPVVVFSATFSPTLERTEHHPLCIAPLVSSLPPSLPPLLHPSLIHPLPEDLPRKDRDRSAHHTTSARSTRNRWSTTTGGRSSSLVESN